MNSLEPPVHPEAVPADHCIAGEWRAGLAPLRRFEELGI